MTFDECKDFKEITQGIINIVQHYKDNMYKEVNDMTLTKGSLKLELEYFLDPKQSEGRKENV